MTTLDHATLSAPAGDDTVAAEAPAPPSLAQAALRQREQRLPQVIVAALCGLGISTVAAGAYGHAADASILLAAGALLIGALTLVRRGQADLGVTVLLSTLTVMATLLAWIGHGVGDPAILVFPGILIFAGMFGARRLLWTLLGLMLVVAAAIVVGEQLGWRAPRRADSGLTPLVHVAVVLIVTGYCVRLVTGDLRRALTLLEREYRRVLRSRAEIERLARHDALTGLPNRMVARARFDDAVAASKRSRSRTAAMILDLDHFQTLNDSLGHPAGDALLRQAARRLQDLVGPGDVVCRLGGDEFLLLLCSPGDADSAAALAAQVLDAVARPYLVDGAEIETTASIGIALTPDDDGAGFDDVLKATEIAMYQAKAIGGNTFRFFDAQMNSGVIEHTAILAGMRAGLARGEFALHFQPQHDLLSGEVIGAEALLRWNHPELGAMPPSRFIPVAERSGFIFELGTWVLREACCRAADWLPRLPPRFCISVNVSPVQIRRGDLERVVLDALSVSGLPPQRLELELTESILIEDSKEQARTLGNLRAMGVHFAIDDFGTGYSNLAYLKRFEVSRLKIDQSFVRRLTHDAHDAAIVSAIIQMARSLRLTALAEGVEDGATLSQLKELGCEQGQGFQWAPALPAAQFLDHLQRSAAATG